MIIVEQDLLNNSLHAGYFFMFLLSSADFFSKLTLTGQILECHAVWIPIRTNILSGSKLFAEVISRRIRSALQGKR